MTKKILIIGLTERMGGVETFIYNTTRFSNKNKYIYYFLVHGTNHVVFQKQITSFYNGKNHFFFVPSMKKNPIKCLKALSNFYKHNAFKYDYIHLETGATSEIMYVYPFVKKYNLKVITHSHNGNGYSRIINNLFRPLVNKVSYKELSCSKEATDWLFGKKREKLVKIIHNGIDTKRFTFNLTSRIKIRKKYHISSNTIVIGHIGRFAVQKNHKFILKIFKKINAKQPDSILLLVGTGELRKKIKNEINNLNLKNKVILCGEKGNTEDYYSAFDIFLMPSLYEGLPVVGIEAQCEGLPCYFSSNISSQVKITDHAFFISLKQSAQYWANEILSKKSNIQKRKGYARKVLNSNYSIFSTVKELESVYM